MRRPRPVRREPAPSEALLLFCSPFDPVALEDGRPVVVGRRADVADLVLHSEDVSRRHAEFERRGDEVFVRDLESANGTFLNGEQVSGSWKRMDLEGFVSIGSWQLLVGTPPTSTGKIPLPTSAAEAQGEPLRGELADRSVVKLLRQVEDEAVSGVLEVSGPTSGRISFVDGLPWSASAGDGSTGVAAIEVLLGVRVGAFALSPEGPQDEPRQIVATSGELLAQLGG